MPKSVTDLRSCNEIRARGLLPDVPLLVSEWSDKYRVLTGKAASEKGPWRTSRTPYLREVMDCLSPQDATEEVVVMKGSQLGFTEAGTNWIGYVIHHVPGPMLVIQPTVDMAKRNSRQRIEPLIEGTTVLTSLVKSPRARDSGNTVLSKEFPGGIVVFTGANSAVGLRSMPVRYLFADEIDGYPGDVDGEGDPLDLAIARTRTFSRRKIFEPSTPTIEGFSKIDAKFKESDQRYFWVPCPHCLKEQTLKFPQLRWPRGEPEKAVYLCEHCSEEIHNYDKTWMLERGRWIKQVPENRIAGFHLSSLYSPVGWFSWADVATAFDKAQKDPAKLKVFINTVLGETWKERGEAPDWDRIFGRREAYDLGIVQPGGLFLTAGADIQKDRIEVEVVAWGRGKTSWSIDYRVIPGDTSTEAPWLELDKVLAADWPTLGESSLPIALMAIDTGYRPQMAYQFCSKHPNPAHGPAGSRVFALRSVMPVKGDDNPFKLISSVSTVNAARKRGGLKIVSVGGPVAKQELYDWLRCPLPEAGGFLDGYCHFPSYEREYFQGLCSEQRVVHDFKGRIKVEWVKKAEFRNEPLDCRVYARAAASVYGIDRFREKHWREFERRLGIEPAEIEPIVEKTAPPEETIQERVRSLTIRQEESTQPTTVLPPAEQIQAQPSLQQPAKPAQPVAKRPIFRRRVRGSFSLR